MKPRDELIINLGDTHNGGLTALFPNYSMQFKYDDKNVLSYSPTPYQAAMYEHFISGAVKAKEMGKGKKLRVILNGDAIDGNHHGTIQIISPNQKHQSQIHIEVMENFLDACGFSVKNGDELHYVSGTESHTRWDEYGIREHFDAIGAQYHDELKLEVNSLRLWWVHEGPKPGKGANEGNAVRNFARDVYWDCLKSVPQITPPHLITASHYHKNTYDVFADSYRHTIHIQVLPSYQGKTRYGQKASPFQRSDIGMVFNVVTAGGDLRFEPYLWDGSESVR